MVTMAFRAPIGVSDFRKLRERGLTYVDKSRFVRDVLESTSEVLLIPRPRRFGKTLNLSTLRYFVEAREEDLSGLFADLEVWRHDAAREHFQRYPVIYMTFKDVKFDTWEMCRAAIGDVLAQALRESGTEDSTLTAQDRAILDRSADEAALAGFLERRSQQLAERRGAPVILLIDEYDAPIHAGYVHGYADRVIRFFRNFLSGGLKDNPHLHKGILTGILRVAKENIFSGLNNVDVHTILSPVFADAFGFTDAEVAALATLAGADEHLDDLRRWYNGYRFGGAVVYNPWSVIKFLSSPDKRFHAHWVATSSNDLFREVLLRGGLGEPSEVEAILRGDTVRRRIDDNVSLRSIRTSTDAAWGLLLLAGYLTASGIEGGEGLGYEADLRIPNREVRASYHQILESWLRQAMHDRASVQTLTESMLGGDVETFEYLLGDILRTTLSYFDLDPRQPERVYHAFMAGLLVALEPEFEVRSNRESGLGRYDLMVLPTRPGPGVVLELKSLGRKQTVESALEQAERQLVDRDYAAELRARGAAPVRGLAVVFDGKEVHVRAVQL